MEVFDTLAGEAAWKALESGATYQHARERREQGALVWRIDLFAEVVRPQAAVVVLVAPGSDTDVAAGVEVKADVGMLGSRRHPSEPVEWGR
ncbi:MAG TPA: hypothetical protein VNU01_07445 [Egibacteraceae bacterium]|nr:hypothetical protein [Egibacteraceae bacterium]